MALLPESFYKSQDVVDIARSLLGKYLFTQINNELTGGIISETEAYNGIVDKASHAYGGRRTKRTEVMFGEGGRSYVYLCYGMHHLVNVVTAPAGIPHAILIRGIIPVYGTEIMLSRCGKSKITSGISNGPGKLTKALGINMIHNNLSLRGNEIFIEDREAKIENMKITVSPRIGIDYAAEDAMLPYRFVLESNNQI